MVVVATDIRGISYHKILAEKETMDVACSSSLIDLWIVGAAIENTQSGYLMTTPCLINFLDRIREYPTRSFCRRKYVWLRGGFIA